MKRIRSSVQMMIMIMMMVTTWRRRRRKVKNTVKPMTMEIYSLSENLGEKERRALWRDRKSEPKIVVCGQ